VVAVIPAAWIAVTVLRVAPLRPTRLDGEARTT